MPWKTGQYATCNSAGLLKASRQDIKEDMWTTTLSIKGRSRREKM